MTDFLNKKSYDICDLLEIMTVLRGENGCPWDIVQTHQSIKMNFVEEVYEAVEAIDLNDKPLLREELGDVLLQVVFHCQIEKEISGFSFDDVCNDLCRKLIQRHPHVFGNVTADTPDQVVENWDNIKQDSKGQLTYSETLSDVAKSLPALMYAQKIGKRAARAGMDFDSLNNVFESIRSELSELQDAAQSNIPARIADELGDLIFSCVNAARHLNIDAESALKNASNKFIRRFQKVENLLRLKGIDMKSLSIDELDAFWREAKNDENY